MRRAYIQRLSDGWVTRNSPYPSVWNFLSAAYPTVFTIADAKWCWSGVSNSDHSSCFTGMAILLRTLWRSTEAVSINTSLPLWREVCRGERSPAAQSFNRGRFHLRVLQDLLTLKIYGSSSQVALWSGGEEGLGHLLIDICFWKINHLLRLNV